MDGETCCYFVRLFIFQILLFDASLLLFTNGASSMAVARVKWQRRDRARLQGMLLCENQKENLICPDGKVLRIHNSDYGRRHKFICGLGKTKNCSTKISTTAKMKTMCDGRAMCYVDTSDGRFIDACPGEIKYLHVVYRCVKQQQISNRVPMAPNVVNMRRKVLQPKCGKSKPTQVSARVVEGMKSPPGKWPWQALMLKGRNKRFICGGTLIHPRWVLTAAHCIKSRKKNYYTIRLGDLDRGVSDPHEQEISVKRAIRHPDYFTPHPLNNDVALLELEKPAKLNDRVGLACLPSSNYELPVNDPNTRCYITGWGKTRYFGHMAQMLRHVEVPPVDRKKCARRLAKSPGGSNRRITKQMICGGDDNTGVSACQGDSGGPYVCQNALGNWEVHGVISWGSPICSLKQRYTVFAQVSKFRKWIDKYLNAISNTI
ncbi:chymotrypsin-like elastase family member 2A [Dendronephthya gigantea]|uniref:chymotrypsin-like elastase family member 2A n=1 Tax=Dendronephthya gigantea TaxID=151771 RepID=UPI00106A627B|nr:chymotrypsin-like elastase family member 2A [Dendronephthya gigantea]